MAGPFGSCCRDLADSFTEAPNSLFRVDDNGVLYLAVGYVESERGIGWYDQAVAFCPFCGAKLQDEPEPKARRSGSLQ